MEMKTIEKKIIDAINSEPIIEKHIEHSHWISGSSTVVYPITLWHDNVVVQINTKHNYFGKAISRVLSKHRDLFQNGYFCKNDDSCPAEIKFVYTEETKRNLDVEKTR